MIFGAHVSIAGGLDASVQQADELDCETYQIFTKSQRQWAAPPLQDESITRFQAALARARMAQPPCVHASYLINLAAAEADKLAKSRAAMCDEIRRAHQLGLPYVIVHAGAHMGRGIERGLERVAESAIEVLEMTRESTGTMLLLENAAGQGTTLGASLEQLGVLRRRIPHPRLGFCLDTCHLFAAGYEFKTPGAYAALQEKVDAEIGRTLVKVVHFNDSAAAPGSRRDRHAAIGHGEIGSAAFAFWIQDAAWKQTPGILETPGGYTNFRRELQMLKNFRDTARKS